MMMDLDAHSTMTLLLPHLTPKEAAPLAGSCKLFWGQRHASKHLNSRECANIWFAEYEKFIFETEFVVRRIGKLLALHYRVDELLNTTISHEPMTKDQVWKIGFFEQKKKPVPVFSVMVVVA
jgi:hypothetical protein